jgi:hypothetical protein
MRLPRAPNQNAAGAAAGVLAALNPVSGAGDARGAASGAGDVPNPASGGVDARGAACGGGSSPAPTAPDGGGSTGAAGAGEGSWLAALRERAAVGAARCQSIPEPKTKGMAAAPASASSAAVCGTACQRGRGAAVVRCEPRGAHAPSPQAASSSGLRPALPSAAPTEALKPHKQRCAANCLAGMPTHRGGCVGWCPLGASAARQLLSSATATQQPAGWVPIWAPSHGSRGSCSPHSPAHPDPSQLGALASAPPAPGSSQTETPGAAPTSPWLPPAPSCPPGKEAAAEQQPRLVWWVAHACACDGEEGRPCRTGSVVRSSSCN